LTISLQIDEILTEIEFEIGYICNFQISVPWPWIWVTIT